MCGIQVVQCGHSKCCDNLHKQLMCCLANKAQSLVSFALVLPPLLGSAKIQTKLQACNCTARAELLQCASITVTNKSMWFFLEPSAKQAAASCSQHLAAQLIYHISLVRVTYVDLWVLVWVTNAACPAYRASYRLYEQRLQTCLYALYDGNNPALVAGSLWFSLVTMQG